mgnify:FL=1
MKLFKKLMAVALAGALALTVLTGCGSVVNEKELFNIMQDMAPSNPETGEQVTLEQGDGSLARKVFYKLSDFAKDHTYAMEKSGDEFFDKVIGSAGGDHSDAYDYAGLRSIIPEGSKDAYLVRCAEVPEVKNGFLNDVNNMMLADKLMHGTQDNPITQINPNVANRVDIDKATVHLYSGKIGEKGYVVCVIVLAAK